MSATTPQPTLVVVSGPAGVGKTTLAHALARGLGCPAICRDEIKEGMVHALGVDRFEAAPGDDLTMRTLPVFFAVVRLLLDAGSSVVAEAAFQDKVWRPNLTSLADLARVRVVQCHTDPVTARRRRIRRGARPAHADHTVEDDAYFASFQRVDLDAPSIDIDTTTGYAPSLADVIAFVDT